MVPRADLSGKFTSLLEAVSDCSYTLPHTILSNDLEYASNRCLPTCISNHFGANKTIVFTYTCLRAMYIFVTVVGTLSHLIDRLPVRVFKVDV
ncbi:hypothetical protein EJ06DRAFT_104759 [Trichodelitschia bisporula]|uniref:Uncharacterized protein n=1 Tax=Trichodelitschia bisporula TaxID=703511 RepID=A0A6G1HR17_9PEZI|nr:hypothetical protein EJ06DRAFT_104759 [Trichodelitschia bisporula]